MEVDCQRLVELLHDFVSGELPREQLATLQAHLEQCAPCGIYLSTYKLTISMTRRLPPVSIPNETAERLKIALEREFGRVD